jgi:Protein of unknown function (DUF2971)
MWYHYADQYRGVVLEFRCDDALDSAWLAARPVTYPAAKPAVYTADGWAQLLMTQGGLAIQTLLDVATYTKAPDWSYEREWRITSFKRQTDGSATQVMLAGKHCFIRLLLKRLFVYGILALALLV